MTLLVGVSPDARDDAGGAVGLGARLAAAWDEELVGVVVVAPGAALPDDRADAEAGARASVAGALAGAGRAARWITVEARSPAEALVEAAREPGTTAVVLGTDADRSGRVATRVARASPVPVVLARGSCAPGEPVTRLTCAYVGTRRSDTVLTVTADLARRSGAVLRLASFAVRRHAARPAQGAGAQGAGAKGREVVAGWAERIAVAQTDALERLGIEAECAVFSGDTWDTAVHAADWHAGDLIVVGSSPGAGRRLFLGDRVGAILQAAPVPAVIVPRG